MSDIAQNALRYNTENTVRRGNGHNNGEIVGKQKNGDPIVGFDCSGFVCHVIIESGYRIDYVTTGGFSSSNAFSKTPTNNVLPGDVIHFGGHVGIVIEYDSNTGTGSFKHMSGTGEVGEMSFSYFITKQPKKNQKTPDGKNYYYGARGIVSFYRVNNNRYSAEVDLHLNGSNPKPTLRPLGRYVYRDYVTSIEKAQKAAKYKANLENKTINIPTQKKLKTMSVPDQDGYNNLNKRIYGNLPDY